MGLEAEGFWTAWNFLWAYVANQDALPYPACTGPVATPDKDVKNEGNLESGSFTTIQGVKVQVVFLIVFLGFAGFFWRSTSEEQAATI